MADARRLMDEKLTKGLAALGRKQDEMADQLAFSPSGQDSGGEAAHGMRARPFEWAERIDNAHIFNFIRVEHPQLAALVLSFLGPQQASVILGMFDASAQPDLARRIACMGQAAPEILQTVEQVLEKKLIIVSSQDHVTAGGVDTIVEMLGMAGRSTERNIIEALGKMDPALAGEIKKRLFVFEDIVLVDANGVARIVARLDPDLLLRALKGTSDDVKGFIWTCLAAQDAAALKTRSGTMGSVRLRDVEDAQQKIVSMIREMAESGEIVIAHPGEIAG
jgi:flagellar motor switch protein FliG